MSTRKRRKISFFMFLCAILQNKYKTFFRVDIQLYQHSWKLRKLEIVKTLRPSGVVFLHMQFLVFSISTRVDITVYQHGKCFVFVNYKTFLSFISFDCIVIIRSNFNT
jgi:hypothetical protein